MSESRAMKAFVTVMLAIFAIAVGSRSLLAQSFARSPAPGSADAIQILAKKIDEQNAKIDMLSQQILKLQQELSGSRPGGVMIGEGAPAPAATTSSAAAPAQSHSASTPATAGNTYTVSRGDTLTSIAKMHKVTVDELQKTNHIENPLKLQVGQTIMIPGAASSGPSASPGE